MEGGDEEWWRGDGRGVRRGEEGRVRRAPRQCGRGDVRARIAGVLGLPKDGGSLVLDDCLRIEKMLSLSSQEDSEDNVNR